MSNKLIIGLADKTAELIPAKSGFLLIDDGPVADAFSQKFKRAKQFDPQSYSFNPLSMTYRKARDFSDVVFGEAGKDTLTVRIGKRALVRLLLKAKRLDNLAVGRNDDEQEATTMVDDLLLSPVLKDVLCKPTSRWVLSGASIVARINRAELGDHDAKILGALLISQFKGQIIVPDFGFYVPRLTYPGEPADCGRVHTFRNWTRSCGSCAYSWGTGTAGCTYEDAQVLAKYEGYLPNTNAFNAVVQRAMN
jgi:hypothetical protein